MTGWTISFAPLLPWVAIAALTVLAGMLSIYGLVRGVRGSVLRLVAWTMLAMALANPSLLQEDREPLKTIVAVVTDESDSQKLDQRDIQTENARKELVERLGKFSQFEVREVRARNGGAETGDASTALFGALNSAIQDVPPEQIGGAILLTDGQVHDIPGRAEALGFTAPLHALITGSEEDKDRRVVIRKAPRFGIVGTSQEIIYTVLDKKIDDDSPVDVRVSLDGELISIEQVVPGQETSFFFEVPHGGKNVVEFQTDRVEGELTEVNNRAFTVMDGIRENLRVLLVSGEPHAGERTWRNLLKSDASVDLVHFTILRPPEKQDGTPINQLSLIAFPTRELFIEKVDEFDLIIFDRYQRRGVLPVLYFDNIARYVKDGGAILIAAGPEHADISSVHRTPLSAVLPVEPTGTVEEAPFRPQISEAGRRHPVTRGLEGLRDRDSEQPPDWSRWFRLVNGTTLQGDSIMEADSGKPLLVLDRPGKGRIAVLMSDHVWLWARGFEGGGPHTQLLRRLGHWLMKEPELDEEALRAEAVGNRLVIERQTMEDEAGQANVITPTGENIVLELEDDGDGIFTAEYEAKTLGLFRVANGDLTALASVGPANPREYAEIVSTTEKLSPLVEATNGLVARLGKQDAARNLPRIVPVRQTGSASGSDWMGLRTTGASVLKGVVQLPLLAGFLGLGLLLMAFAAMWAREGR